MTKTYILLNNQAMKFKDAFVTNDNRVGLCKDTVAMYFPELDSAPALKLVVSNTRQHRKGEQRVELYNYNSMRMKFPGFDHPVHTYIFDITKRNIINDLFQQHNDDCSMFIVYAQIKPLTKVPESV